TKEGKEKLERELSHLKNTKRKEVASRIRNAAAMGDLSENFDYQNAKEEQGFVERRIAEIETILSNASLIEHSGKGDRVEVGSRVALKTGKETWTVTITGPQEADPLQGKISASSPLGQALLGRRKGETAEVGTPQGKTGYEILEIS
ncbi:MAG: transcription elongation factor GreA, partial [bacterium]|nr:transcription elongation factor GreA [bacterium]